MRIHLLAVGTRMPSWVVAGYEEYARRLPRGCALRLVEIPAARRVKGADGERSKIQEGERLLAAVPGMARVVALELTGARWSTRDLAVKLETWMAEGQDVAILVGGPDGLSRDCLHSAGERWSLSPLTLPHALVRVVVAEQLYRACSILQGHPYHR